MTAGRVITDEERRARLVRRHHLGGTAADVVPAVRGVVAMHSSDPVTIHLAVRARTSGATVEDVERQLYDVRSLWRLHAMRRTLFVVPLDEAPVFLAAASTEIAGKERDRLSGWLADGLWARATVAGRLGDLEAEVLAAVGERSRSTRELTAAVPGLAETVTVGAGKWRTPVPLSSRLLFLLALEGRLVRTRPAGSWRSSQYGWARPEAWFGAPPPAPLEQRDARAELVRRYLEQHGPVTLADVRWWAGWTVRAARQALQDAAAVEVELDGAAVGHVAADDPGGVVLGAEEHSSVALLPGLDPTPMGWKDRAWFLGPHAERLFDRNGNAGPTVWVDGRAVGAWGQRPDGSVAYRLLEHVTADALARLRAEVAALERWLDGAVVTPRFRAPLERELARG